MRSSFRQKINIKYFMVAYLGLLLLVASMAAGVPARFFPGLAIVVLYALFDLAWTRLRDHVWYLPVSSWISGLVLANVGPPMPSWWLLILLPFIAVAGKQLVHLGKARHVFNPAALALFIMTLYTPVIAWWAPSTDMLTTLLVALMGVFILWRQERWHVALSFVITLSLGTSLMAVANNVPLQHLPDILWSTLSAGSVLFFASVMLIEPVTSSFPTRAHRIIYGAIVGGIAAFGAAFTAQLPIPDLDPLVAGLLIGDLAASLAFLPPRSTPST